MTMIYPGHMKPDDFVRLLTQVDQARARDSKRLAEAIDQHAGLIKQLIAFKDSTTMSAFQDYLKEIITHSYSKATAYNNIIVLGGYVAFFSMWHTLKDSLSVRMMLFSALSMSFSAAIFVLSHVYVMVKTSKHYRRLSAIPTEGVSPEVVMTNWKQANLEFEMSNVKAQPYFLYSTLGFAVIGLGLIFASFIAGLIATFIPPSIAPLLSDFPVKV